MSAYRSILLTLLLMLACHASAEFVVVAHQSLKVESLTKKEVIGLYMGRDRYVGDNIKVIPLDVSDETIKAEFYLKLVERSLSEVNSYWARLLFSGRAKPPLNLPNTQQVIDLIRENPAAIGYIRREELPTDLKVISYVQ